MMGITMLALIAGIVVVVILIIVFICLLFLRNKD